MLVVEKCINLDCNLTMIAAALAALRKIHGGWYTCVHIYTVRYMVGGIHVYINIYEMLSI